jgi:hypothetical protein
MKKPRNEEEARRMGAEECAREDRFEGERKEKYAPSASTDFEIPTCCGSDMIMRGGKWVCRDWWENRD